jgi:hypothetical protein
VLEREPMLRRLQKELDKQPFFCWWELLFCLIRFANPDSSMYVSVDVIKFFHKIVHHEN